MRESWVHVNGGLMNIEYIGGLVGSIKIVKGFDEYKGFWEKGFWVTIIV